MENYIAPEIPGYAASVVKAALGTKAAIKSVEWTAGGLYNKVFYVYTCEGCFILKIECDKIFPSIRIGQMENEVKGSCLVKQAGLPCAQILAHDFSGNDIGVRYVFMERISGDIVWGDWDGMDDETQTEVRRQSDDLCARLLKITNSHFGSLTSTGPLGWHKTWDDCYRAWFNLLIGDSEKIGLFTGDELTIVKAAADKPLKPSKIYLPTFDHGDFGWHNMIWGSIANEPPRLHVIDFGNARFIVPQLTGDKPPHEMPNAQQLDKGYNLLLLYAFEMGVMWKEMAKMTSDYAHCTDGLTAYIEDAKKDTSRTHITEFVKKCEDRLHDV